MPDALEVRGAVDATVGTLHGGDRGLEVVDPQREVVTRRARLVGGQQVHLSTAGDVEPGAVAQQVGARREAEPEDLDVEAHGLGDVVHAHGDVVEAGRLHGTMMVPATAAVHDRHLPRPIRVASPWPGWVRFRRTSTPAAAARAGTRCTGTTSRAGAQHVGHLDGKTIAVTGAGRGIGAAVARACAAEGAAVVVNDLGVAVDGTEPSSEVAQQVVADIEAAGGRAVADGSSVTEMEGGAAIVQRAVDTFGRIDGVVCVAGILRERMLFNMSEEEWDPVVATHLKGTFTVFRAAAPIFREQRSGTMIGFTSGAFAGSVAQANYSAAKGGIVSLVRSAAAGMHKYGVTANAVAPVAKSRMSGNVPFGLEMGEPEDVAPMVCFLLSDLARHVTGQVYTANGPKVAVWNQPAEVREMRTEGRWSVDELAARFDEIGQERMPLLDALEERARAAAAAKESGATPNR